MSLVSVIVPVYKVENYIERCAHSLFGQTLQDMEFIFVNDGTPDRSMELLSRVLEQYPGRKNQVRIVTHLVNKGLPSARNSGLKKARGVYVVHCDSDDWVEQDMYERMYTVAIQAKADIVWSDFYQEVSDNNKYRAQRFDADPVCCVKALLSGSMHGGVWNKLVRRSLYENNELRFFEGINTWEDLATTLRLFCCAVRIVYYPYAFYHYQYNPSSIMRQQDRAKAEKRLAEIFVNVANILGFLEDRNLVEAYRKEINYLKLHAKSGWIGIDPTGWCKIYPEANPYIFSCPMIPWHYKLMEWLCARGYYRIPLLRNRLVAWLKCRMRE